MPTLAAEAVGSDNGSVVDPGSVPAPDNIQSVPAAAIQVQDQTAAVNHLPQSAPKNPIKTSIHLLTAYNSDVGQTDDSPCITATGFNVCEHVIEDTVAANFLPFGAKIRIPSLFGDKIFTVRDRMNVRYSDRVDIWMKNRADALKFGVRLAKIEIIEP